LDAGLGRVGHHHPLLTEANRCQFIAFKAHRAWPVKGGKNTIGHATNLARTPIWHARPRRTAYDTVVSLFLFGHPFPRVEGRNLSTTDQRLFAHLTTAYVRAGCPESRQVPFSLSEASALLGYETAGGR